MDFAKFLMMRHELLLVFSALIILIADLALEGENKRRLPTMATVLFGIVTVIGFLPVDYGSLFGGMYRSSELLVMMKNILNIGVLIILIQSIPWLQTGRDMHNRRNEFVILILSTLVGMNYMISSGDFLMFFLGLELATIPIAALASYERYKMKSAEAGIKMILSSALSTGITLFGVSLIYGGTGSVYFHEVMPMISVNPVLVLGLLFFFAGMAFKISIVPFHFWTPDVYEGAPISVTAYLSVISKGAAVFIFTILLFTVFRALVDVWTDVLYVTAILTMTIGNLFAMRQKNLKRFLAFSSIAQAGFILLGVLSATQLGMASVLYFVLIYIFSNLGAFGVVNIISLRTGKENREDYNGLYKTNPNLSLVLLLSLFSLAGIPPVAGFFGKFFLFSAAAQSGYYILVLIAVLNATISLYYYLLVVKAMFIDQTDNPIENFKSDLATRVALIICTVGILAIGFASPIFELLNGMSFGI